MTSSREVVRLGQQFGELRERMAKLEGLARVHHRTDCGRIIGEQRNEVFPSLQMGRFSPAALALLQLRVCPIPRQYFPSELRKVRPNRVFQVTSQGREVLPE